MAVNDVYQVKASMDYDGQQCLNVFWYQCIADGVGVGATQLITQFNSQVWDQINDLMVNTVTNVQLVGLCYADVTDTFTQAANGGAINAQEPLPAFFAHSFASNWPGPGRRRARKRFVGVSEDQVSGSTYDAAYAGDVAGVESRLAVTLSAGGWSFIPVIVTGPKVYGTNPTVSAAANVWTWSGWSTQNSRKP